MRFFSNQCILAIVTHWSEDLWSGTKQPVVQSKRRKNEMSSRSFKVFESTAAHADCRGYTKGGGSFCQKELETHPPSSGFMWMCTNYILSNQKNQTKTCIQLINALHFIRERQRNALHLGNVSGVWIKDKILYQTGNALECKALTKKVALSNNEKQYLLSHVK